MDLAELIRQTRGSRTMRDLAEQAGEPSHQRWQQMASGKPMSEFLKPSTINAISRVLGVRPQVVIKACAETLGFSWEAEPRLLALLPPGIDDLNDEQIDAVRTMILAFQTAQVLHRDFRWESNDRPGSYRSMDDARAARAARTGRPAREAEEGDDEPR